MLLLLFFGYSQRYICRFVLYGSVGSIPTKVTLMRIGWSWWHCYIYFFLSYICWSRHFLIILFSWWKSKDFLPEKYSESLFCADTFPPVCVLLCNLPVIFYQIQQLKIFVHRHAKIPHESIRVQLQLLYLCMELSFARQTTRLIHGMHLPHLPWRELTF